MRRQPHKKTGRTNRQVGEVLTGVLKGIAHRVADRPDLVLAAWPELVGPLVAQMTEAVQFCEGVLEVRVKNSTLYALLERQEKKGLLARLRKQFPRTKIWTIKFRLG